MVQIPNRIYVVYDSIVVRLRQLIVLLTAGALVLYQHEELLDFRAEVRTKNIIKLISLIILALNGSAIGKDRKQL